MTKPKKLINIIFNGVTYFKTKKKEQNTKLTKPLLSVCGEKRG